MAMSPFNVLEFQRKVCEDEGSCKSVVAGKALRLRFVLTGC